MNYDNDADLETVRINGVANQISRLERKGICFHLDAAPNGTGGYKCKCGATFPNFYALMDASREQREEYL